MGDSGELRTLVRPEPAKRCCTQAVLLIVLACMSEPAFDFKLTAIRGRTLAFALHIRPGMDVPMKSTFGAWIATALLKELARRKPSYWEKAAAAVLRWSLGEVTDFAWQDEGGMGKQTQAILALSDDARDGWLDREMIGWTLECPVTGDFALKVVKPQGDQARPAPEETTYLLCSARGFPKDGIVHGYHAGYPWGLQCPPSRVPAVALAVRTVDITETTRMVSTQVGWVDKYGKFDEVLAFIKRQPGYPKTA